MNLAGILPVLLGLAWLLPLASFVLILFFGPRMGRGGRCAGYLATTAILSSFVLSLTALACWLSVYPLAEPGGLSQFSAHQSAAIVAENGTVPFAAERPAPISGDWYELCHFGNLALTVGYYIDALTLAMFCMVTLVASCIHVYSFGYMHEELDEVTDPLVRLDDGQPLHRRGRFHRFYQYLSLFCFSMLGLVVAGNLAMVFAFWELVGICSYLLIGFYIERKTASNAANKAFIVNRVGDFGMIVGLMAIWAGMGTFAFGGEEGIFSQVRAMAIAGTPASDVPLGANTLLVIAGLGIFCGCVGKSAQFPLHVWLPDAMEGPTPVSALIHAATMVAAGVYLVGRFYPVFTPEVLLVIAYVGCATLVIGATIAITATDIKRVLAYSTVSQLGYMMLALGVGGWLAGIFHLFTHAFFKSLLFLCSGSVIHATHTNEMPAMGGLIKKMPWTAGTMLVGCLAIAGAGIPTLAGLSGYYSKDYIIAQTLQFQQANPRHGWFFWVAVGGAAVTACYMFRLWYLTFLGAPRDEHIYAHAHESPRSMIVPLVILSFFAIVAGGNLVLANRLLGLEPLLEQARPVTAEEVAEVEPSAPTAAITVPSEHGIHNPAIHGPATVWACGAALAGFLVATIFYGTRWFDPEHVRRLLAPLYWFLWHKWWFDELYNAVFVRPTLWIAQVVAVLDKYLIDGLVDGAGRTVTAVARLDDWIDRVFVDGSVNLTARVTYAVGLSLRRFQTGNIRQYVMLIAVGTVALFLLASFFWS
jgi:NADH-quinone oxidoreductase subunit L